MNTLVVMSSASTESFEAFDTGESKYFSSVLSPEDFDNADALLVFAPGDAELIYTCSFNVVSRQETEIWKKIAARLTDLNAIFYEDEHTSEEKERYLSTSKLLVNVLQCLELRKFPLIGIADDGQVGASWHGGTDGDLLFILPRNKSDVSISYVNEKGELLPDSTTLDKLETNGAKAILPLQKALPWYN